METPASTSDSGGAASNNVVFLDTNLDSHLAMIVSDTDTVSDLKKRIQQEHPLCFPNVGEIQVFALKVKRRGKFYHLSNSMLVKSAFRGVCNSWFLSVDASSANERSENYNPLKPDCGNLIAFPITNNNTSADAVDLLPDGPSKRLTNFEDTFLPQDGKNQLVKHNSVVQPSDSPDSTKDISENLQIGIKDTADNNHKVSFRVAENDPGKNVEGQTGFVNLQENELSGKFSKPCQPVKKKRKRESEDAGEKSLGENRRASNPVKESSRREITSPREGEKGKNEEHPNALVGIQDHISIEEALQSGPVEKKVGSENSLAENITSDSVEDGTRLDIRRSRDHDKGENVDHHIGFISIKKSKLTEDSNMDSLRITETVGRHLDGEANIALASGSISAGATIPEPCIASPKKGQKVGKTNHVLHPVDYDVVQANDGNVESQTEEPGLRLSSKKVGAIPVDQHSGKRAHPPLVSQQPNDLQGGVYEHSNGTGTLGNEMVEAKNCSKKIKKSRKTQDQVGAEPASVTKHSGGPSNDVSSTEVPTSVRGDELTNATWKDDPPFLSQRPKNLQEDNVSEYVNGSAALEAKVMEPKKNSKSRKESRKTQDQVEAETTSGMEHFECPKNDISSAEVCTTVRCDDLTDASPKGDPRFLSQEDVVSKYGSATLEANVVEPKKNSKKRKKSRKTQNQVGAETESVMEHSGVPANDISSAEVPTTVRGDDLTDASPKQDQPFLSQQANNLQEHVVSEYDNWSDTLETEVVEPKKNSKKRKKSRKIQNKVGAETESVMEHSGGPKNDISSAKIPTSMRGEELTNAIPKEDPPFLSQQPNNLQVYGSSEYDNGSATLEAKVVKRKQDSKKRKNSRKTQDQVGIETVSVMEHSGGLTNDISPSEVPTSIRGDNLSDITRKEDVLAVSQPADDPLELAVSLHDNKTGTLEAEVVEPKRLSMQTKKFKKVQDHVGEEKLSGTGHFGGPTSDISQVLLSVRGDHVATHKGADDVIRDVLESLQQSNDGANAEDMDRKSSKKIKKQKSSVVVDSPTLLSNDASHRDHEVSADNVDEVKISSKSTKKSKKVNSSSVNQLNTSKLEVENGRRVDTPPEQDMPVTGSPRTLSPTDEGVGKSGSVKIQNRLEIVAGGEIVDRKEANKKEVIKKVEAKNPKKKLDQPSGEPDLLCSPELNEDQDSGAKSPVEIPLNVAKAVQSNKSDELKFIFEDAQRLNSFVKSSHLKKKMKHLVSANNTNKKSDEHKSKLTVRNASEKNNWEVLNSSQTKKSLFGSTVFRDEVEESSDDEGEINNSDASPRTPSNNSALLDYFYDNSDADADSSQTGEKHGGRSITKARHASPKSMPLHEILRNSSRYKKAKLIASQSQLDEDEEECVPDSQAK